jgi:TPR repeat protein
LNLQGRGVEKDTAKAAQWFRRAADNGDIAGEVEFSTRFLGTPRPLA